MRCYTNKILGLIVVALSVGILLTMFLPAWILAIILAAIVLMIGILLLMK